MLPSPYKHDEKNFWQACGFLSKDMEELFTKVLESKEIIPASKALSCIEDMEISTRAKMALSFCVAGYLAKGKFDKDMAIYMDLVKKEVAGYQREILRLGVSLNKNEFGKIKPRTTTRTKSARQTSKTAIRTQ